MQLLLLFLDADTDERVDDACAAGDVCACDDDDDDDEIGVAQLTLRMKHRVMTGRERYRDGRKTKVSSRCPLTLQRRRARLLACSLSRSLALKPTAAKQAQSALCSFSSLAHQSNQSSPSPSVFSSGQPAQPFQATLRCSEPSLSCQLLSLCMCVCLSLEFLLVVCLQGSLSRSRDF